MSFIPTTSLAQSPCGRTQSKRDFHTTLTIVFAAPTAYTVGSMYVGDLSVMCKALLFGGMPCLQTLKIARRQKERSGNKKQSSVRYSNSFLNMLLYSDRMANVFMPTASRSITSGLPLKGG